MPVLTPREMNGFDDYDRGLRGPNGMSRQGRYDPYRDDFERVDPYRREDDDLYNRGPLRRFGDDFVEHNNVGMKHTGEPSFELDHLATFAALTRDGYIQPEDGLLKLRQMENTTGIWTMRCVLLVDRKHLIIVDNQSGDELEKFPIQSVHSPTAIFNKDSREIYNNLLLFTIGEDPKKRTQADMHIFQSVDTPAQLIVDEILLAQKGGQRTQPQPSQLGPNPSGRNMYDFHGMKDYLNSQQQSSRFFGREPQRSIKATRTYRDDYEPGQNEVLERDVLLLNHCFDDIEKFVSRLQQAAESFKELEKRHRESKKRQSGEGLMGYRARPPPSTDFTDIFKKFKLSFNLLAKLKAHIHDPNAPELVHFLFTPLSLIYEASRDPIHGGQNLAESAIAPVLTDEAKELLVNCLTSKEIELWRALGTTWTTSRGEWKGYVPSYTPRFYDGWQPSGAQMENGTRPPPHVLESEAVGRGFEDVSRNYVREREDNYADDRYGRYGDYQRRNFEPSRASPSPRQPPSNPAPVYRENIQPQVVERRGSPVDENAAYLQEMKAMGQKICEATHQREGRNNKELSLKKGEYVCVLDDSKKWWKVRNAEGKVGFAPYTILKEIKD